MAIKKKQPSSKKQFFWDCFEKKKNSPEYENSLPKTTKKTLLCGAPPPLPFFSLCKKVLKFDCREKN
jgi:hypothetical protein